MRAASLWSRLLCLALAAAAAREALTRQARSETEPFVLSACEPRRMSVRTLRTLPGLGERLARAVAEERARCASVPFRWEDVPGLGPLRAATLRARMVELGHPAEPFESGADRYPDSPVESRSIALALLAALAGCDGSAMATDPGAVPVPGSEAARVEVHRLGPAEVHLQVLGPAGTDGVLFLHGARYSSAQWLELGLLEHVAKRGVRALALDWPGSGASPAVTPAPEPAELLAALLTATGLERVVLVAPSRGGAQALALLARGEPRVLGLLAVAPGASEAYVPAAESRTRIHLLWGEADEVVPIAAGEAFAARLPGVRLERVPAAGHAFYLEAPERLRLALDRLLDELGWSAR